MGESYRQQSPSSTVPTGAFIASHDDRGIAAFLAGR
jgi:hypothetical protein